jgi:hypothetical protein
VKENTVAKRTFFALFLLVQLVLVTVVTQAQPYQVVNTESSVVGGNLNKTVTAVQEGDKHDRQLEKPIMKWIKANF